jgi:hypothetical protein
MKKNKIMIKDIPKKHLDRSDMRNVTGGTEWKYIAVQRYYSFIEPSIDNNTGWNIYDGGKG